MNSAKHRIWSGEMSHWESEGQSNDWYTPKYIFDALGCVFDLDVAAPVNGPLHVPCLAHLSERSLDAEWSGFIWMNPPFGGRNGLIPWLDKFMKHKNGIALVPDRTSAPWWQQASDYAEFVFFINGKVKFIRPDGSLGKSPSVGTTLFGIGSKAHNALHRAEANGLGRMFVRT